ncbi:CGNR zinc finger domain-containing protein [Streptomyces sp. NPDC048172]|uniref:CGNR zinc finger domain-containing protein n=1 Tax=Streptomyces sp. NPDC048172 TaxID=3365505 RepID=UPI003718BC62
MATDLVVTGPPVGASDLLADERGLAGFLARHGLAPDALDGGRPSARDLAGVRALRDEVRELLGAESEERVAEGASALVARAGRGPVLARDAAGEWQWYVATEPGAPLAGELAVLVGTGLLGALRTLGHARFRGCASPDCGGLFVDTSKAGRRRYCMPEVCGNRLNVANYRARQRPRP